MKEVYLLFLPWYIYSDYGTLSMCCYMVAFTEAQCEYLDICFLWVFVTSNLFFLSICNVFFVFKYFWIHFFPDIWPLFFPLPFLKTLITITIYIRSMHKVCQSFSLQCRDSHLLDKETNWSLGVAHHLLNCWTVALLLWRSLTFSFAPLVLAVVGHLSCLYQS